MAHILTLHLVNDLGSDSIGGSQSDVPSAWPGTPVPYDFTTPPQAIRPVWVGVSSDGLSNQVYPLTATVQSIITAGWPRVYQGTEIVGTHGDVHVFSERYTELLSTLSACCNSQVATGAYLFRSGRYSLDPTQPNPPCGAEAIFKLLAVLGSEETRALSFQWGFQLVGADGDTDFQFVWSEGGPLPATQQRVLAWPTGFYGLVDTVDNTRTLVADDDSTTDPSAVPVGFYAGGTITLSVLVYDPEDEAYFFQQAQTFRLPDTDCGEQESGSAASSAGESSSAGGPPPVGFVPNIRMRAVVAPGDPFKLFDFDVSDDTTGWVNWGDGTPDEPMDTAGSGEFTASHLYATPGEYIVQVRVDDPTVVYDVQIASAGDNQLNAYEFLVPFTQIRTVNMVNATRMDAFSFTNLPAVNDVSLNGCNFTQAGLDGIIAQLDATGPNNGILDVSSQGTGAVPNTAAAAYVHLDGAKNWTITHS